MEQCEHLSNLFVLYASEKKASLTGLEWNEGANKIVERYYFNMNYSFKICKNTFYNSANKNMVEKRFRWYSH